MTRAEAGDISGANRDWQALQAKTGMESRPTDQFSVWFVGIEVAVRAADWSTAAQRLHTALDVPERSRIESPARPLALNYLGIDTVFKPLSDSDSNVKRIFFASCAASSR